MGFSQPFDESPIGASPFLSPFPFLPVPVPLIGLLPDPLDPLSSLLTCHNAHQRVPHPHAHECGGVPHCPALHDPGEAKSLHLSAQTDVAVREAATLAEYDGCGTSHELK